MSNGWPTSTWATPPTVPAKMSLTDCSFDAGAGSSRSNGISDSCVIVSRVSFWLYLLLPLFSFSSSSLPPLPSSSQRLGHQLHRRFLLFLPDRVSGNGCPPRRSQGAGVSRGPGLEAGGRPIRDGRAPGRRLTTKRLQTKRPGDRAARESRARRQRCIRHSSRNVSRYRAARRTAP